MTRNNFISILLCMFSTVVCVFGVAGCSCSHTQNETVEENRIESTCAVAGKYDEVVYCKDCHAVLSRTEKTLYYAEHKYANGFCSVCGEKGPSEGLEFELNDDAQSYSVKGIGTCTDNDLIIPSTHNDKPVTAIGIRALSHCNNLTSIAVPSSVKSIYSFAFESCKNLKNVTLPDSLTTFSSGVFFLCDNIQYNEYDNAYYLGSRNNPYVALINANAVSIEDCTIHKDTKIIGGSAFSNCSRLTSITIPDGVISIESYAFSMCFSLTSITIPDSVTSIGDYAFATCKSLKSIKLPDSVTSIGAFALESCDSLTSVIMPNSITSIAKFTFSYCTSLTSILFPNSITSIGWEAFKNCDNIEDVYYSGTETQWDELMNSANLYELRKATCYYYRTKKNQVGNYWHYVDGVPTKW